MIFLTDNNNLMTILLFFHFSLLLRVFVLLAQQIEPMVVLYLWRYPRNLLQATFQRVRSSRFCTNLHWLWVYIKSRVIQRYREVFGLDVYRPFPNGGIIIQYEYMGVSYNYVLKKKRGLRPVSTIVNEHGKDIMDEIRPFLGPNLDCHHSLLHPRDFFYDKITVELVDGTLKEFRSDDQIKIF